jgi:hypothetical protein
MRYFLKYIYVQHNQLQMTEKIMKICVFAKPFFAGFYSNPV